ncbi:MAG: type II CAAX endopeptidase family protein [bacterium]
MTDDPIKTPDPSLLLDQRTRTARLLEVLVFVFLILPALLLSFVTARSAGASGLSFAVGGIAIILRDLALMSLVLFFVWRNGEPRKWIGWVSKGARREAALGLLLVIPMFFAAQLVENAARAAGLSSGPVSLPAVLTPHGGAELALALVMVVVVAVSEETIFRGYLILRLSQVTGNRMAAALVSSFVFSLGHGYEGSAGVVTVGFLGLVFATVFLWRKSLVAPMVMHFVQDFIGIVLVPALEMR